MVVASATTTRKGHSLPPGVDAGLQQCRGHPEEHDRRKAHYRHDPHRGSPLSAEPAAEDAEDLAEE